MGVEDAVGRPVTLAVPVADLDEVLVTDAVTVGLVVLMAVLVVERDWVADAVGVRGGVQEGVVSGDPDGVVDLEPDPVLVGDEEAVADVVGGCDGVEGPVGIPVGDPDGVSGAVPRPRGRP